MDRLQPAYVLLKRPYSNTSLLLELFTPDFGRLAVIAKGARGKAGRHGGFLQPFVPLDVTWSGRGEVKTLLKSEAKGRSLLSRGRKLFCGFYLNELLTRLMQREDPHADLFEHYVVTLVALASTDEMEPLLRRFEVALLESIGYGMQLLAGREGEPVMPELQYHYAIEQGPLRTGADDASGISGETLLALAGKRSFTLESSTEGRRLMRRVMAHYLGDKPLKSRELFRSLYS